MKIHWNKNMPILSSLTDVPAIPIPLSCSSSQSNYKQSLKSLLPQGFLNFYDKVRCYLIKSVIWTVHSNKYIFLYSYLYMFIFWPVTSNHFRHTQCAFILAKILYKAFTMKTFRFCINKLNLFLKILFLWNAE